MTPTTRTRLGACLLALATLAPLAHAQPGISPVGAETLGPGGSRTLLITNATGTFGGSAGAANGNVGNSGWTGTEYGDGTNFPGGGLFITATNANKYTIKWAPRTVANPANADAARRPANFSEFTNYSWIIYRPYSDFSENGGDPNTNGNPFGTPSPFVIGGIDASTLTVAQVNTALNSRLQFDPTDFWNWTGSPQVPLVDQGTFSFSTNASRQEINLNYSPVPEPRVVLAVTALGLVGARGCVRLRRRTTPHSVGDES